MKATKDRHALSPDNQTIYEDENVYVLGDTSESVGNSINYVGVKFKPHIYFSDFPSKVSGNQKKAPLLYSSNPIAKEFKTVITQTYKKTNMNFGGHYVFVEWGCGLPCQSSALVDIKTGIVYDGVSGAYGYNFKENSRMIIVNPPDSEGFYLNCAGCEPEIHVWNEAQKKFIQR